MLENKFELPEADKLPVIDFETIKEQEIIFVALSAAEPGVSKITVVLANGAMAHKKDQSACIRREFRDILDNCPGLTDMTQQKYSPTSWAVAAANLQSGICFEESREASSCHFKLSAKTIAIPVTIHPTQNFGSTSARYHGGRELANALKLLIANRTEMPSMSPVHLSPIS